MVDTDTPVYSIRLPKDLAEKLKAMAEEKERSFNWQVRKALEAWLFDQERGRLATDIRAEDVQREWDLEAVERVSGVTPIDILNDAAAKTYWSERRKEFPGSELPPVEVLTAPEQGEPFRYVTTTAEYVPGLQDGEGVEHADWVTDEEAKHITPPFDTQAQQAHMEIVKRAATGDVEALAQLAVPPKHEDVEACDVRVGDVVEHDGSWWNVRAVNMPTPGVTRFLVETLDGKLCEEFQLDASIWVRRAVYDSLDWDIVEDADQYAHHVSDIANGETNVAYRRPEVDMLDP